MKKSDFQKHFLKKLPEKPGVYFFLDNNFDSKDDLPKKEHILYIGKATSLRDRVGSYFSNDLIKTRGLKIQSMIENAKGIFFIEAKNVLEAIILESKYIKKFSPFFNTREKDDKSYSYVILTNEDFPRVLILREREIEKFTIDNNIKIKNKFGPFISKAELLEIMKTVRKFFPYRDRCQLHQKKPCFNYQIGLCPGTCIDKISKKDYQKNINYIKNILKGETSVLISHLEKEMKNFAKLKEFERAKEIRDKIFALENIKDLSFIKSDLEENIENKSLNNLRIEAYDVSHISGKNRVGVMTVIENSEIRKDEYKKFKLQESVNNDISGLKEILERRFSHLEWGVPNIILIDGGETHLKEMDKFLKNILPIDIYKNIILLSLVKDDKHKAREILFINQKGKDLSNKYKKDLILVNSESHRFAISYHKFLRNKI